MLSTGLISMAFTAYRTPGIRRILAVEPPLRTGEAWPLLGFRAGEIYERRLRDKEKARAAYAQVPAASPRYKDAQKRAAAK